MFLNLFLLKCCFIDMDLVTLRREKTNLTKFRHDDA